MNQESNQVTLNSYEVAANAYANATSEEPDAGIRQWLGEAVKNLSSGAAIFEIGSATGRDARYLQSKGFRVQCSDAASSFVSLLEAQGFHPVRLNVLTDPLPGSYNLIFANAVFVHFTHDECVKTFTSLKQYLHKGGRIAFTVIHGEGEEWSNAKIDNPRYFSYWSEEGLKRSLEEAGYTIDSLVLEKVRARTWLNVVASLQ